MAIANQTLEDSVTPEVTRDRRGQLIDATVRAVAEHGLSGVTLAKVAKIAGLSPGIVTFYFKTKEQLLLATLHHLADEYDTAVEQAIAEVTDPAVALAALIDVCFGAKICTVDKVSVWYAFVSETRARQDYLAVCGKKDIETQARIRALFDEIGKRNPARAVDADAMARGLEGVIDGFWQELLYDPDGFDRDHAKAIAHAYLCSVFPEAFPLPAAVVERPDTGAAHARPMLAPWTYRNREFFDLEIEQLFRRQWLLAGHVSELAKPGDYVTFDALGERALVIHGQDGELRAFHNVCRHRGSRVVQGASGHCPRAIVCPFHGWTYNLDGTLKNVPAINTFDVLDKGAHGLVPLATETWMGFVFVRFSPAGPSLAEMMGPVEDKLTPYRLAEMVPLGPAYRELRPYNWKVVHDIDNEGYHVPIGHPSLQALYGRSYEDRIEHGIPCSYGYVDDQKTGLWSVMRYKNILPPFPHLPQDNQKLWFYVGIFPNLVLALYPEKMEFYMTLPLAPDRTAYLGRSFGLPDTRREVCAARYLNDRINRRTDNEDRQFVDWIQEGLSSSVFPHGTLSSIEIGVRQFHEKMKTLLPVGSLSEAPVAGAVAAINARLASA